MIRRSLASLLLVSLGLSLTPGCGSEPPTVAAPAPNGADYGANKLPPPERLAPKGGQNGARSPGAPPVRR